MLQIENKLGKTPEVERLKKAYQKILKKFAINPTFAECGLHFVNKHEIQKLNQKYRGLDKPTDVLSFPIDEPLAKDTRTQGHKDTKIILGDIFLCLEMVRPETGQEKTFIHGLLHLLGLNHQEQKKYGYL